ncbi:MAG: helix-turn-helix domain-containing protein, partial [Dehalococcoidales bacterium]|nr:helix-turn-helix domain-containing protein [Dehalococcoidales bacterium]
MAVFRVEKTRDYTVMANHHLKNRALTLKAKGLLSLMLSLPEDWDYTLKGLSLISVEGIDAIREAVRELECAGYIIRSRERNGKGQLKGTEYVIYEKPHSSEAPPGEEKPAQENPTQLNTKGLKTHPENTQTVNPHGANPYPSNPNPSYRATGSERTPGWDEIGYDEAARYRETVRDNLEYDLLVQDRKTNRERLDEIVDLIVEMLCSTKPTICVSGDDYPSSLVKEKLLRLTSTHMDYVFECLDKNTTYVRNIKKYLLA